MQNYRLTLVVLFLFECFLFFGSCVFSVCSLVAWSGIFSFLCTVFLWRSYIPQSCLSIARIGASSSIYNLFFSVVCRQTNASAAWCIIAALWITSKIKFEERRRHRASQPLLSVKMKIHLRKSWSVRIVNRVSFKLALCMGTSQTTAKNSFCFLSYLSSSLLRASYQYHMHRAFSSSFFYSNTHSTCSSHEAVSMVINPL